MLRLTQFTFTGNTIGGLIEFHYQISSCSCTCGWSVFFVVFCIYLDLAYLLVKVRKGLGKNLPTIAESSIKIDLAVSGTVEYKRIRKKYSQTKKIVIV